MSRKILFNFLITFFLFLILIGILYYVFNWFKSSEQVDLNITQVINSENQVNTPIPTPVYFYNPINGTKILESDFNLIKNRPFLAVIIQNNIASRPQSGLNESDIVYEALVESNITRFMAIYWSKDASRIQSIRSARHYFVELLGDYGNPVFMHIGYATCLGVDNCNPKTDALVLMNKYKVRRLSDLINQKDKQYSFLRDLECQKVKAIEHCAYSSTSRLWEISSQQSWTNELDNYKSWTFSDKGRDDGDSLDKFIINFESAPGYYDVNYSVKWVYDSTKNTYLRFNYDDTPFLDSNGEQVYSDVIIYQKVNAFLTGDSKGHMYEEVIGSGDGFIMQNGKVFNVNWFKNDYYTKTLFVDSVTSKEFDFKRGKIWVNIVPKHSSYKTF